MQNQSPILVTQAVMISDELIRTAMLLKVWILNQKYTMAILLIMKLKMCILLIIILNI